MEECRPLAAAGITVSPPTRVTRAIILVAPPGGRVRSADSGEDLSQRAQVSFSTQKKNEKGLYHCDSLMNRQIKEKRQ